MRNIWTIARREIRMYFASPIAYIVGLLTLLITGIYFVLVVYLSGQSAYTSGYASAPGPDLVIGLLVFIFLFAIPALSMRLMADEHRNGTLAGIGLVGYEVLDRVVVTHLGCGRSPDETQLAHDEPVLFLGTR